MIDIIVEAAGVEPASQCSESDKLPESKGVESVVVGPIPATTADSGQDLGRISVCA